MTATVAVDESGQAPPPAGAPPPAEVSEVSAVSAVSAQSPAQFQAQQPADPTGPAVRAAGARAESLATLTAWIGARPAATARLTRLAAYAMREYEHVDLRPFPGCSDFTRLVLPVDLDRAERLADWMSEPARHGAVDTSLRVLIRVLHLDDRPGDAPDDRSAGVPQSRDREAREGEHR